MRRRRILAALLAVAVGALPSGPVRSVEPDNSASGNPIVTDIFTADPGALVHDGTLYVYTGHDEAPLGVNDFVMRDWHVYSTTDAVHWTDHGVRLALSDFAWANRNAWAGDVVHRNGKFYWY